MESSTLLLLLGVGAGALLLTGALEFRKYLAGSSPHDQQPDLVAGWTPDLEVGQSSLSNTTFHPAVKEWLDGKLFVTRGDEKNEGHMNSNEIKKFCKEDEIYQLHGSQLVKVYNASDAPPREVVEDADGFNAPQKAEGTPTFLHKRLEVSWFQDPKKFDITIESQKEANILGGTGVAIIHNPDSGCQVRIPAVRATPENVAAYGARLLRHGDYLQFEIPAHPEGDKASTATNFQNYGLPAFNMSVGKHYPEQYLKVPSLGGGAYLERHNLPHLHIPQDENSGGYLMLGKFLDEDETEMAVTAFKIPLGCGIYTKPNTLHQDAFLTGNLEVVYANASDFQTSFLYTKAEDGEGYTIADVVVDDF